MPEQRVVFHQQPTAELGPDAIADMSDNELTSRLAHLGPDPRVGDTVIGSTFTPPGALEYLLNPNAPERFPLGSDQRRQVMEYITRLQKNWVTSNELESSQEGARE